MLGHVDRKTFLLHVIQHYLRSLEASRHERTFTISCLLRVRFYILLSAKRSKLTALGMRIKKLRYCSGGQAHPIRNQGHPTTDCFQVCQNNFLCPLETYLVNLELP